MNRSVKAQAFRQLLLVAGLVLGVLILALCWPSHQPSYQGHPLAYLVRELPMIIDPGPASGILMTKSKPLGTGHHERPTAAIAAIRGIGTNAIPFLMQQLRREEPPQATALQRWLLKLGYRRALFANLRSERGQAATALIILGPLPAGTAEELRQLSNTRTNSPAGRYAALVVSFATNALPKDAFP